MTLLSVHRYGPCDLSTPYLFSSRVTLVPLTSIPLRLPKYLTPEILRTPLHELALTIKLLGLGEIGTFLSKAMEPPPAERVTEAVVLLHGKWGQGNKRAVFIAVEYVTIEMEALDVNEQLTPLGTILARLPIEPRMGKMIVLGCVCG